jgi:hypothetical protein
MNLTIVCFTVNEIKFFSGFNFEFQTWRKMYGMYNMFPKILQIFLALKNLSFLYYT